MSDVQDEKATISTVAHVEEKTLQKEEPESKPADLVSVKDTKSFITPSEEAKESVVILTSPESSAVTGSLPLQKRDVSSSDATFPPKDAPKAEATSLWERWWIAIASWFLETPS
jgi:hypothetical protein